jgi:phage terminase small subunit
VDNLESFCYNYSSYVQKCHKFFSKGGVKSEPTNWQGDRRF